MFSATESPKLREVIRSAGSHDLSGLAAQLAFRFMHATLWFLVLAAASTGYIASRIGGPHPVDRLMQTVFAHLPDDIKAVLDPQLHRLVDTRSLSLIAFGAAASLVAGTVAFMALMKALNQVRSVEDSRPFYRRALIAFALTLTVGALALLAVVSLLVELLAGPEIAARLGIDGVPGALTIVVIAFVLAILVLISVVVYRVPPRDDPEPAAVAVGVGVFIVTWLSASLGLALYLSHFGRYANAIGVVGALLVLFSWFYVTALALLFGAEINVAVERQRGLRDSAAKRQRSDPSLGAPTHPAERAATGSSESS
jgi:membrane protein